MVGKWKKAAIEGLLKGFAGNDTVSSKQREIREPHAKIRELVIEKALRVMNLKRLLEVEQ